MLTEYFGNYLQASYEQNSFVSPAILGIKCDKKSTCIRSKTHKQHVHAIIRTIAALNVLHFRFETAVKYIKFSTIYLTKFFQVA